MREKRNVHINVTSNVATSMNKGTVASTGLSTSLKGVATSASLATGGIRAMTMALISSGVGAFVVLVGALAGTFMGLINQSRDFAQQMSNLKAVLGDGATPDAINALSDSAKRLGATTAFTATQVGELQVELAKMGFDSDQILASSNAVLALASASGTDLANASAIAAGTLRGFNLTASDTMRVVDVMASSFSKSSLDISKFQESMKQVAPIASTVGVTIEEASASLAVLANRGISGSLAGNQLKRIMSDLAQKTGKSFRESLTLTSKRLENATSSAEKLAIAKELVGDRAKGSLIALAENTEELDRLSLAFDNAGGSAQRMAEDKLDNLNGDLTKLSSAWSGFMLNLEDGGGIMSSLARGSVKLLTGTITYLQQKTELMGFFWTQFINDMKNGGTQFTIIGHNIMLLAQEFQQFGIDAQLALKDVPFFGGLVNEEALLAQRAQLNKEIDYSKKKIIELKVVQFARDKATNKAYTDMLVRRIDIQKKVDTKLKKLASTFVEDTTKKDEEGLAKLLANREKFFLKLKKLEEDATDKTEIEKIERKRLRHIAELELLKLNTVEKNEAVKRINDYYAGLTAIQENEDALKLKEKKDKDKEATDLANQEIRDKEEALRQEKIQGMYGVLDTASEVAGRETDIAKALQAIKLAIQLSELASKMGIIRQGLIARAQSASMEAKIEGGKIGTATASGMAESSKIGFPWNIISMAGYALQAVSLVKAFTGSKRKLDNITSSVGGGSVGGASPSPVSAPSFNVLGATSAGENMIADTVASTNNQPMRAYVVESEVSSSQSLRRNALTMASIG
tara:strand:+ start:4007 stop:6415 length:2409 start_codon:yes stop_codon:yes gene_type:complete